MPSKGDYTALNRAKRERVRALERNMRNGSLAELKHKSDSIATLLAVSAGLNVDASSVPDILNKYPDLELPDPHEASQYTAEDAVKAYYETQDLSALCGLYAPDALAVLRGALHDPDPRVKCVAAKNMLDLAKRVDKDNGKTIDSSFPIIVVDSVVDSGGKS